MRRKLSALLVVCGVSTVALFSCKKDVAPVVLPPPQYTLNDFTPAAICSTCHAQYYDEWKGSMHRYSTSDPIWMLASNALQTSTQGRLKDWCFQCHAPLAWVTAKAKTGHFQFSDLEPFVREGITCDFCHVLRPPYLTTDQRIQYNLAPGNRKYGTLTDPVPTVHEHGYDSQYDRSTVCRMCHDLVMNNVPVEITYTEWQDSPWGAMSVECQSCHMRTYTSRAAPGAPIRNNLHRHTFAGVDVAITDFPNRAEQLAEIDSLLKNAAALTLTAPSTASVGDTVAVEVSVFNDKTGHNLPTSVFFNRQMWLEVTVWNGADTIFRTGHLDANGDLMDRHSQLRPNEDTNLVLFSGTLYRNGQESNVFELDSLVNNSLKPFECRTASYRVQVVQTGAWNIKARLLFRPFGPYLFRALGATQYVTELPIFEMTIRQSLLQVN